MLDDDQLLLFTTNRQRDQWAAITWDHHLAIGSAQAGLITTRPVAASIPAADTSRSLDRVGTTVGWRGAWLVFAGHGAIFPILLACPGD